MRDADKQVFEEAVAAIRDEGRYRVFADIMRERGRFPHARMRLENGAYRDVVVWCSNDYLGQGQEDLFVNQADKTLLSLPIGEHMSDADVVTVSTAIKSFFG